MGQQGVDQGFENHSMDVALEALGKGIARWTDKGGLLVSAISALSLARRDAPTEPTSYMYEPSVCVIAQGANDGGQPSSPAVGAAIKPWHGDR
jgi:AraC-type transcriptional regulator